MPIICYILTDIIKNMPGITKNYYIDCEVENDAIKKLSPQKREFS